MTDMRKLAVPKYYEVGNLRKVVCTTQRAGSTSMIEAMRPAYPDSTVMRITDREALTRRKQGWPVLLWMRNPLERFASAYAIFGAGRIPSARNAAQPKYRTPQLFAELVFTQDDAHWAPMTRLHTVGGIFLPTRVYPFYNLAETWAKEMPGYGLALLNRTERKSWDDLVGEMSVKCTGALIKHYEEDTKMLDWCEEFGLMENVA
jgi:hypothetical protein